MHIWHWVIIIIVTHVFLFLFFYLSKPCMMHPIRSRINERKLEQKNVWSLSKHTMCVHALHLHHLTFFFELDIYLASFFFFNSMLLAPLTKSIHVPLNCKTSFFAMDLSWSALIPLRIQIDPCGSIHGWKKESIDHIN